MAAWNELLQELDAQTPATAVQWLNSRQLQALRAVRCLRSDRNVILYGSAFLQKPQAPGAAVQITAEDLNGLMAAIHGMDCTKGLSLILHTPGGQTTAAETIVAYLRSKFTDVEVIVPTFAMSAGTMISLAANRIIMGRQSQLGPIDPQMPLGGRFISARGVVDQFNQAKKEILGAPGEPGNSSAGLVWAPVLQTMGPSLLVEAQNALDYGQRMVGEWSAKYMFKGEPDAEDTGTAIAAHFNDASNHKSHGRRIDRDEARSVGVVVEDLEAPQAFQEAVLTAYHLMTIAFERGPASKIIASDAGKTWLKSWAPPAAQVPVPAPETHQPKAGSGPVTHKGPVRHPSGPPRPRKKKR